SRHIAHCSSSVMFPQVSQNFTLSRTSTSNSDSLVTSKLWVWRIWKVIRCADFGPIPGSLPNSSMSSCTMPSYMVASEREKLVPQRGAQYWGYGRGCSPINLAPSTSRTTASPYRVKVGALRCSEPVGGDGAEGA